MKEKCYNHPENTATNFCHSCGHAYCFDCLMAWDDCYYCKTEDCQRALLIKIALRSAQLTGEHRDLVYRRKWGDLADDLRRKRGKVCKEIPLEVGPVVITALHYIPYLLATLYYSWVIHRTWLEHRGEKHVMKKLDLWIDESIDRIMYLVPQNIIGKKNCKKDMKAIVKTFPGEIILKDLDSAADVVSNKMFNVLIKYYPKARRKERELLDYIVRAELIRLKGK